MDYMEEFTELLKDVVLNFEMRVMKMGAAEYQQEKDRKINAQDDQLIEVQACDQVPHSDKHIDNAQKFYELIPENSYNESLDSKINHLKINSVSLRRKDELFKRHKKEQQERIVLRRKQIEQKYAFNERELKFHGEFTLHRHEKNQIFAFKTEDFEKLRPETDLNDTIIDNYLKLMQLEFLPSEISKKTFIFSSFFMGKLLGELKEQTCSDRQNQSNVQKVIKKVQQAYPTMKRWTKKSDLFAKQYLVVPINAYKHWNCMIIVSPSALLTEPAQCKILYLDSVFQKKAMFPQAIKTYFMSSFRFLELELQCRKNKKQSFEDVVTYQLLVPRQTNNHDCGLYTLCYIEYLLKNHQILELNMEVIDNRYQLRLFPRSLIFAMRELLRVLFKNLLNNQDKSQTLQDFVRLREKIQKEAKQDDYDSISERQFKKYYRMNSHLLEDKKKKQSEIEYLCKVKFYLDCEINHYEKDQTV